jgi:uncharacterized protein (DUF486 family)
MTTQIVEIAGGIATVLFGVVMVLQLFIAVGIIPITMAWGGRQERLTVPLRIASLAAVGILGFFAYVIRYRAGLMGTPIPAWIRIMAWIVTAYLALNSLGNIASKSKGERLLFGPITIILTVVCLLVAISSVG